MNPDASSWGRKLTDIRKPTDICDLLKTSHVSKAPLLLGAKFTVLHQFHTCTLGSSHHEPHMSVPARRHHLRSSNFQLDLRNCIRRLRRCCTADAICPPITGTLCKGSAARHPDAEVMGILDLAIRAQNGATVVHITKVSARDPR